MMTELAAELVTPAFDEEVIAETDVEVEAGTAFEEAPAEFPEALAEAAAVIAGGEAGAGEAAAEDTDDVFAEFAVAEFPAFALAVAEVAPFEEAVIGAVEIAELAGEAVDAAFEPPSATVAAMLAALSATISEPDKTAAVTVPTKGAVAVTARSADPPREAVTPTADKAEIPMAPEFADTPAPAPKALTPAEIPLSTLAVTPAPAADAAMLTPPPPRLAVTAATLKALTPTPPLAADTPAPAPRTLIPADAPLPKLIVAAAAESALTATPFVPAVTPRAEAMPTEIPDEAICTGATLETTELTP